MRCNKISAFYLYSNHTERTNKIFKGFIFGNTNIIYTFAETKLTGEIPGKDMKIKESDLLNRLATDSGKTANQVAEIIISELLKREIVTDTPDNWGGSVFDAINEDVTEEQTAECFGAISEALGVYLKRVYSIVPDLDLFGDGDCPFCGGEMEVTDGEYKPEYCGYDNEPNYRTIWEEKTCPICDYKVSSEPSY
jgi:hypothetical protein